MVNMNDTLLYNEGLDLLKQFLNKWLVENHITDTNNEYKIFLPKINEKDSNIIFLFPIYKFEEEKWKLISWISFNATKNSPESINFQDCNVYNEIIENFDFEINKKYVTEFYNIFILELNIQRVKNYSDIFEQEKNKIQNEMIEYNSLIKELNCEEYSIENEPQETEIKKVIEKVEDETPILDNVKVKQVSETTEKTDYEYALEMIEGHNSENEKYEFEWNAKLGLNYVTDESLELAYMLIKDGAIKLKPAERERKDKNGNPYKEKYVIIESNIKGFCNYDGDTTSSVIEQIKNEKINKVEQSKIFVSKRGEYSIYSLSFDNICYGCGFQTCPKQLAAYILYLKNNGKLEEVLKERRTFRDKEKVDNSIFRFKWEVKDGLKCVNEKIYQYAEELVKRNIIFVKPLITPNGYVEIRSTIDCKTFKMMNAEIDKLPEKAEREASRGWLERSYKKDSFEFCNAYTCLLDGCPYEVAGYIYYLRNSGREKQIEEDRKYYAANKEEIEKKNQEKKKEALKKIDNNKNTVLERFGDFKDSIVNIKNLVDVLASPQTQSLHCFVEGEDEIERNKFIDKIFLELKNSGRIVMTRDMSLQNFATMNAHTVGGEYKDRDGKILRDRRGVPYVAVGQVAYTHSEEKTLYILNNITEFINDYEVYKKNNVGYKNGELKKKQFQHVIKLLTSTSNTYFVIVGTNAEKEALLALDPRIKYIYGDAVYQIPGLSIDEMFKIYKNNIKSQLLDKFRQNEEKYEKEFSEYVSLNRNFIPFSDRELVDYLATYTNSKDNIEFPENVYKKETIDEALKNIIGLQSVKDKLKEFEKYMLFQVKAKSNNMKLKSSNMHMIFTGNPGTGKTTFARIMAKMLYDLGMLKENKLVEVEKKDLIASYIGQTAPKTAEVIESAIGGVLFIDEAYSITEGKDAYGKEAVATLIKAMEDRKDELVVIFAGYKDEMKTFMDSNAGITSRIGYTFDFPDYTPNELVEIFNVKMKNMGFEINPNVEPQILNICEYFSKRKSFGNGRFVDKLIQEMILRHATNDTSDIKRITKEDIPAIEQLTGSSPNYNNSDLKTQLNNIVGMQSVKDRLVSFEKFVSFNKKAVIAGLDIPNSNMHMIFTGNPGTGKTTIARIIAKMLFDIGVIYENKLVEVERKDLISEYVGRTAPKTNEVIEKAMGGVLFIDEAYTLAEGKDSFGKEAIATLIKAMEDHKGEFVVIFAGYRDEMKTFTDMNPGIASRIGYTFDFPDYTPSELLEIFKRKMSKIGFELSNEIEQEVLNICEYFSKRKSFGNGRFVDKLIQETIMKHTMNESENIKLITLEDIPEIVELNSSRKDSDYDAQKVIDQIVGMKDLKEKISEFTEYIKFVKDAQNSGINIPNQNMHMIFTGNPGTGKTTVARVMAKLLFDMGFIHENKLVEVERKDLVAEYIGQTAPKTSEVIEKAMGGVLFIDEAYTLASGKNTAHDFGAEAIATLIKAMEDHKGEFIVIFAGYQKEMQDFLNMNPGIASRVGYTFDFLDYSASELEEIYYRKIQKLGFSVAEDAKEKVHELMQYFESVENIGNGRFADKVAQNTLMKMAKNRGENLSVVEALHIPTIKEMTDTLLGGKNMIDPNKVSKESLEKTAAHEVGHALISYLLTKKLDIKKITIKPEGAGTLGYVSYKETDEYIIQRKSFLIGRIKTYLAGMVAEDVYFGEHANGNISDLERATTIAYNMITKFGMSDLGYAQIKNPEGEIAKIVFEEQNKILKKCYDETYEIIKKYKPNMDLVIAYLLEKGEITEEEFLAEFNKVSISENVVQNTNSMWSTEPPKIEE